jgi:hypothetical protein
MPSFSVTAQYRNGGATHTLSTSERIFLTSGLTLTDLVTIGSYQDQTHLADVNDAHLASCSNANGHVNNTRYVDTTHVSINGGGSTPLGSTVPTRAQAPLKFTFQADNNAAVAVSGAKFYGYDGTTVANLWDLGTGGHFYAGEAQVSTAWVAANGLDNALSLADQPSATSHDYYVFFSASPGTIGAKRGKIRLTLTYA